jgi:hypothetical protein
MENKKQKTKQHNNWFGGSMKLWDYDSRKIIEKNPRDHGRMDGYRWEWMMRLQIIDSS